MCSLAWHTAFAIIAPTIKLYNKSIANRKSVRESVGFTSLQTLMEIEICFTCRASQVNCLGRLPCLSVFNILVCRGQCLQSGALSASAWQWRLWGACGWRDQFAVHSIHLRPLSAGDLSAEFSQHVMARGVRDPAQGRRPTPMLPPTAVVAAQLDALQINDWCATGQPCTHRQTALLELCVCLGKAAWSLICM